MSPDKRAALDVEPVTVRRRLKKLDQRNGLVLSPSVSPAVAPVAATPAPRKSPFDSALRFTEDRRSTVFLALGCAIFGQTLLTFDLSVPLGAALLLTGAGLIFAQARKQPLKVETRPLDRWALVGLAALFLVSLAIRLYQNDVYPPSLFYDEAYSGLEGIQITSQPGIQIWSNGLSGRPTFDLYVFNVAFRIFGVSVASLRGATALGGALTVVFTFLAARELIGSRGAWLAGIIMMVSRWDITFSRIAYEAIFSLMFATAVIWLLAGGARRFSTNWLVLASVPFALGLYTYVAYRLFAIPVTVFWLLLLWRKRRAALPGAIGFVAVGLAIAAPMLAFAAQNPDEFTHRFSQVSIFLDVANQHSWKPLFDNILLHVGMFNYHGGTGARHNLPFIEPRLPGVPQLGFPFAVCFALGLGVLAARARLPQYALLVVTAGGALAAGFLTLLAESPDPTRTILVVPITALAAAMFLDLLLVSVLGERASDPWPRVALATPILVALAAVELVTYYRQATFVAAYHEFQHNLAAEALYLQSRLGHNDIYVSEVVRRFPTDAIVNFVDYPYTVNNLSLFDPSTTVPAPPHGRPVAYLLSPGPGATLLSYLQTMYPRGVAETHTNPYGEAEFISFDVPADEVAVSAGLTAEYSAGGPTTRRVEAMVDSGQNPPPIAPPFDARWTGTLVLPTWGGYAFRLAGVASADITIDGAIASETRAISLAAGPHELAVHGHAATGERIQLLWAVNGQAFAPVPASVLFTVPTPNYGLEAWYYARAQNVSSPSAVVRQPGLSVLPPPSGFEKVIWRGQLVAPTTGTYQFWFEADDEGSFSVDRKIAIDTHGQQPGTVLNVSLTLAAGPHQIELQLVNLHGGYSIGLDWAPPGQERAPVPDQVFRLLPTQ
jgi:4-amino-4-deoxy-L-arabinose transferase-like glycosyltransferase